MPGPQEIITSRGNAWLKRLRHAAARGGATASGTALAESPLLLHEALRADIEIERVFASERTQARIAAVVPPHRRIPVHVVADRLFDEVATTSRNQGVLALVRLPTWRPEQVFAGLTLALDAVQDPGNAGSIARSAEAFGASGLVFLKGSAAPANPKALRAAAGSLFRLPFLEGVEPAMFLEFVRERGKALFAADARGGTPLSEADLAPDAAVVIGSESHGVAPALLAAATPVAIPTAAVESLNAAAAAAVIAYEAARRRARP